MNPREDRRTRTTAGALSATLAATITVIAAVAGVALVVVGASLLPAGNVPISGNAPADERPLAVRRATDEEAAILVTVRGAGICSGAPIEGTNMVVTAAHCLIDTRTGRISTRHDLRVEHDSIRYDIDAVILDPGAGEVRPARDAAILLLRTPLPGPGVTLPGSLRRDAGRRGAVLVGLQPVDAIGDFHRGRTYHERTSPRGASPGAAYVGHVAAACDSGPPVARKGFATYACGMVPGGSGGPALEPGSRRLVGVISSVNLELTWNGVTPVTEILRLLADARRHTVRLSGPDTTGHDAAGGLR